MKNDSQYKINICRTFKAFVQFLLKYKKKNNCATIKMGLNFKQKLIQIDFCSHEIFPTQFLYNGFLSQGHFYCFYLSDTALNVTFSSFFVQVNQTKVTTETMNIIKLSLLVSVFKNIHKNSTLTPQLLTYIYTTLWYICLSQQTKIFYFCLYFECVSPKTNLFILYLNAFYV